MDATRLFSELLSGGFLSLAGGLVAAFFTCYVLILVVVHLELNGEWDGFFEVTLEVVARIFQPRWLVCMAVGNVLAFVGGALFISWVVSA